MSHIRNGLTVYLGVADQNLEPEPDPEGSETFDRIRFGTEINVSDPDPRPDPKLFFRIRNNGLAV
jgi:hypothetical protein